MSGIHWTALTYFVRSLGLESSFYLTTGTFNLVVKDRIHNPPERRVFDFRPADPEICMSSKLVSIELALDLGLEAQGYCSLEH
jgi:hypothetical protein